MMLLGKNHNGNVERLLASSITSYNNDSCISKTIADNDHSMSTLCFTPMFRENEFLSTTFLECLQQQNRSPTEEPFLLGSFPVIECEYCTPEYGFHQANCLIYASFMNLQQP
ncbi:hypothetical protein BDF20DRAFT_841916 [Mycotypha africana]|uniref:uncharacterized protein n=1 Tax=Mycotypha africana TaxID=64632 RepID=UPI0023001B95|nr:uncharacterized protein BDF20DRAFT_841916 [Mycotypha africana]KAI8990964.1 hypothetical protein BDF20DRAFT_841916 [Mycotypha africana]